MKRLAVVFVLCLFAFGCGKPELYITSEDYFVTDTMGHGFRVIVKGTVKNAGSGDAKNVVIRTDCEGCSTVASPDTWINSSKQTTLNFVGAGDKENFKFIVARMTDLNPRGYGDLLPGRVPPKPRGLKTKVVSFD